MFPGLLYYTPAPKSRQFSSWKMRVALKSRLFVDRVGSGRSILLGRGVLDDSLGALADGVLGQLARKQQTNGRLDLTAVVVCQSRRLRRDALEDVHEAVHDAHRIAADSRVRMNLLQHLVHVDRVALTSPVLPLLVCATSSIRLARRLFVLYFFLLLVHVPDRISVPNM